jgi:hypothetical protein
MSVEQMQAEDVERLAKLLDLRLKPGNSQTIASLLTEVRHNVLRKASALKQDAPLSIFFDAR